MNSMEEMTTHEAGERLGITQASVRQLVGCGQLTVVGKAGRALLLNRSSVERRAAAGSRRGRAWTPKVAWAALTMLSGGNLSWISPSEKSRLKSRLRGRTAEDVAALARHKDRTAATGRRPTDCVSFRITSFPVASRPCVVQQ